MVRKTDHVNNVENSSIINNTKKSYVSKPQDFQVKDTELKKELFKTSLQKVANFLGVSPFKVSRDNYYKVCREQHWEYVNNLWSVFNGASYAQIREELFANEKDSQYYPTELKGKDLLQEKLKRGLKAVANILNKDVYDVNASDYRDNIKKTEFPDVQPALTNENSSFAEMKEEICTKEKTEDNKTYKQKHEDNVKDKAVEDLKQYIEENCTVPTLKEFKRYSHVNLGKMFNSIREIEVLLYKKYPDKV